MVASACSSVTVSKRVPGPNSSTTSPARRALARRSESPGWARAGGGQEKIKKKYILIIIWRIDDFFLEIVLFYLQVDQNSMLVYIFWLGIIFYIIVHWNFISVPTHGYMLVQWKEARKMRVHCPRGKKKRKKRESSLQVLENSVSSRGSITWSMHVSRTEID